MKVVYASRTGNVQRFVMKLGRNVDSRRIYDGTEAVNEDYLLITFTDGKGMIPKAVETFIRGNLSHFKAAAVSGNQLRFPDSFCGAADQIEKKYEVPIIARFNGEGGGDDVDDVVDYLEEHA